jgi:hypothetical protein
MSQTNRWWQYGGMVQVLVLVPYHHTRTSTFSFSEGDSIAFLASTYQMTQAADWRNADVLFATGFTINFLLQGSV